jgi:hypothetical protein
MNHDRWQVGNVRSQPSDDAQAIKQLIERNINS